ncbi:hypothetical protein [Nocardiopsis alba]|uniref:hypothetical protein n=1 Tax=Nocardiopsis alba TaxID=53437 RepID=UPI0033A253C3
MTVVLDPEDTPLLTTAGPWTPGDLVIRPTPQATGRRSLARDISVALGKNPFESVETGTWELCHAWITGQSVQRLIVGRAHRLPPERLHDLGSLARTLRLPLWLLWSSSDLPDRVLERLGPDWPADAPTVVSAGRFRTELARRRTRRHSAPAPQQPWPQVPLSPCWAFLRDCRRMLAPSDFNRVLDEYRTAFTRTRQWSLPDRMSLLAWLRDTALGPLTDPWQALVWLRAIQSVLLQRGLLLHWDPRPLGPDPAAALPSRLTPALCEALARHTRTDEGALAALALHLDQNPQFFELLTCESVRRDGSVVRVNRTRPSPLRPCPRGWARCATPWTTTRAPSTKSSWAHRSCCHPTPGRSWPPNALGVWPAGHDPRTRCSSTQTNRTTAARRSPCVRRC